MKNIRTWIFCALLSSGVLSVHAQDAHEEAVAKTGDAALAATLGDGVYALIDTERGKIVCELYFRKTPLTVANFVGLAEGTKKTTIRQDKPYFDGLTFHRVVRTPQPFVIQGGCPRGNGTGDPGYRFEDEIVESLRHTGAGILSMANSGPGTNGSQFFVTLAATPWLDGRHTVFGRVRQGMDAVNAIVAKDVMKSVTILRVGADAEAFKGDEAAFKNYQKALQARLAEKREAEAARQQASQKTALAEIAKKYPNAVTTDSGLKYVVQAEGAGDRPAVGTRLQVHYTGRLLDGKKFDSSHDRGRPFAFAVGRRQVIRAWDEALLTMRKGEKRVLIVPPELGYGARGAGRVIPPNAWLIFDVELIDF